VCGFQNIESLPGRNSALVGTEPSHSNMMFVNVIVSVNREFI